MKRQHPKDMFEKAYKNSKCAQELRDKIGSEGERILKNWAYLMFLGGYQFGLSEAVDISQTKEEK